jgi:hypothetical protein
MSHGTYIGDEPALQGKTAIVYPRHGHPDEVLVQFDDRQLQRRGKWLGFGLHRFPKTTFKLDPEVDFDA